MLGVACVDRELAYPLALGAGAGDEVDALQGSADSAIAAVILPRGSFRESSSTRTVTENCALTWAMGAEGS